MALQPWDSLKRLIGCFITVSQYIERAYTVFLSRRTYDDLSLLRGFVCQDKRWRKSPSSNYLQYCTYVIVIRPVLSTAISIRASSLDVKRNINDVSQHRTDGCKMHALFATYIQNIPRYLIKWQTMTKRLGFTKCINL